MKLINIKFVEISTDGAISFSYATLRSTKQQAFYEKDNKNFLFTKKPMKVQSFQNMSRNLYKSKYKF